MIFIDCVNNFPDEPVLVENSLSSVEEKHFEAFWNIFKERAFNEDTNGPVDMAALVTFIDEDCKDKNNDSVSKKTASEKFNLVKQAFEFIGVKMGEGTPLDFDEYYIYQKAVSQEKIFKIPRNFVSYNYLSPSTCIER